MRGRPAALALLLVFVVACGGGSTAGTVGTTSSGNPTAGAGTPATAQPTTAGSAGQPKLLEALAAAKLTQYKITYKYTLTGAGAALSGEQSWYFKPPKQRFDFSSNLGGTATVISFFALADGTYYCMSLASTKTCFSLKTVGIGSPLDANQAAVFQRSMIENPSAYGATFVENKTYAGQTGACYDVTGATGAAAGFTSGRWCYTKEGIMLFSSFGAQGSGIALEATNVSMTVPDSDFELPAKASN